MTRKHRKRKNIDPALRITDDLDKLIEILPPRIKKALENLDFPLEDLLEVVMDLGRVPEARFPGGFVFLDKQEVTTEDLDYVVSHIGVFGGDNRAGIERTLHRISAIKNRTGDIVGLTCRVGRAVFGTIGIIRDLVESGKSLLLLGRPGVGKTTMLREVARVLADDFKKRVIVVDTSNEIAGDGDIPHSGIGASRRMQVVSPERQHAVMIEAVENHMPEVIVVDEIGTEDDAYAARTIAERGVQLIATAHGNTLDNLMMNPTLCDLIGGIQAVTLSDEEAKKRRTQKTVLERKAPPTFDIVVEIRDWETLAVHPDVAQTVDLMLRGTIPQPEIRRRTPDGQMEIIRKSDQQEIFQKMDMESKARDHEIRQLPGEHIVSIFPFAVSRNRLERAISELALPAKVISDPADADLVLALKTHERRAGSLLKRQCKETCVIKIIRSNTQKQIDSALKDYFEIPGSMEDPAMKEVEHAVYKILEEDSREEELSPQPSHI
ncbi:MAG: AAA family ATPase, partial [Candidatus Eremiobacteraeota bacterium]|nr:AAA family ATPase [Candidatus Eremiobacteraeota bacterium]